MIRRPPRSTRTDTLFPYTTLFRSRLETQEVWTFAGSICLTVVLSVVLREGSLPKECPIVIASPPNWRVTSSWRSEEHTSELQSLMRISYAVFCLKKKNSNKYLHTMHLYYYIRRHDTVMQSCR